MPYSVPENEAQRNEAVRSYRIMDTPPEIEFDEIGDLVARICDCPVSYISFVEGDRLAFKAKYGIPDDFTGCPREIAFCSVTVCGADLIVSTDLANDERFKDFYFVVNEPHYRFYAAMPLVTPEGYSLGTICIMDYAPRDLSFEQSESLRRLAHQLVALLEHRRRMFELGEAMSELDAAHRAIAEEKAKSEDLLYRVLPRPIAEELREKDKVEPRFFHSSTVLVADVQGFTKLTGRTEPAALIALLERYFNAFDDVVAACGIEKIKTVGDAYLAVAGVPSPDPAHMTRACLAALGFVAACRKIRREREKLRLPLLDFRIGLHTGPLIAGIVGVHRFTYDIWGDAVNLAAKIEAAGAPAAVTVSERVGNYIRDHFEIEPYETENEAPEITWPMYLVKRLKPEFSASDDGLTPTPQFLESLSTRQNHRFASQG